ncbi:DUF2318 domain-containing protein [Treponema phagedenis]|uniref:Fe-S-containing protein n=1 Tax=Treponema phagedenis TaxID=162 RepID=UPI0019807EF5|nr:Fe-S-containing protein [Treponema phagedenis]QSH99827.1 DUF2318 domain-containing protein [Treponema phagedenis]
MDSGIAFSLIFKVIFAAYRTKNLLKKRIVISTSIVVGIIGSIISAILRSIPNYINRTRFAFWSMIPVVIGLVLLLILMIADKGLKKHFERLQENLFSAAVFVYTFGCFFYYLPPILTLPLTFVYYGESAVSTLVLFRVIGFTLGIVVMLLSALAVYKTLEKLSALELKITVIGSLCILGLTQAIVIVQRLYFLRIIPRSNFVFWLIAFVVNYDRYFVLGVTVFIAIASLILWKKNLHVTESYAHRAELRKLKATKRNARRWAKFLLALLLLDILSLTLVRYFSEREVPLSDPENYVIENGMAIIPLAELEDDKLHRYEYIAKEGSSKGIAMRFIAIKKSEGAYGVGLDACDICGPTGYFERKGEVICKLCDVVMNKGTIGFPGGCNPVPIPYIVHDEKIMIQIKDLEAEAHRFR